MYSVFFSETFGRQYKKLPTDVQTRIKKKLRELEKDPLAPRPGADIKPLKDTHPQKHRLRVGDYRIVYHVDGQMVKLIEVFPRGRGY